jgi:hypothetical protein
MRHLAETVVTTSTLWKFNQRRVVLCTYICTYVMYAFFKPWRQSFDCCFYKQHWRYGGLECFYKAQKNIFLRKKHTRLIVVLLIFTMMTCNRRIGFGLQHVPVTHLEITCTGVWILKRTTKRRSMLGSQFFCDFSQFLTKNGRFS